MADHGQSSVEYILMLGVAMLVFAVMVAQGEEKYQNFRDDIRLSKLKASMKDIANSVDFVYEQGKGAKTRIYVSIPSAASLNISTNANGTGIIEGNAYVRGKPASLLEFVDANLTGSLPADSGGFCIDIECLGAVVNITRSGGSC